MNNEHYIPPLMLTKQFNVTSGTLRKWAEDGKIRYLRPNGNGRRLYHSEDVKKVFGFAEDTCIKQTICYARVSSNHQKEDLERQVKLLSTEYPGAKIIKDIGSGLNWKRPGLNALLEHIYKGDVKEVVVTYKDRLCRFGSEILEWIFKKSDVKLLVLSTSCDQKDISRELSDDLLAITTVFVARNNGLRAGHFRRERKAKEKAESGEVGEENPS